MNRESSRDVGGTNPDPRYRWLFWPELFHARSLDELIETGLDSLRAEFGLAGVTCFHLTHGRWLVERSVGEAVAETRGAAWAEQAWDRAAEFESEGALIVPWREMDGSDPPSSSRFATDRPMRPADDAEHHNAAAPEPRSARVLVLTPNSSEGAARAASLDAARWLGRIVEHQAGAVTTRLEADRLQAVLGEVVTWARSRSLEEVLEQIAHSATRLLQCERATIFLWDRHRQRLVGRPALGVPGNLIEVPDQAGLVGRVLSTGQPQRVSTRDASGEGVVHRAVDQKLGFHTRNLLGVPLGEDGEQVKGVFEVINRLQGDFSLDDIRTLRLLARHAAARCKTRRPISLADEHRRLVDQAAERASLVGNVRRSSRLRVSVERVAKADLAVLILGENGTGKDVVAQQLHYLSARRDHPLVALNCAAIAASLLESELFGHEKGAFTGAHDARIGKFEAAQGGTVFLDEVGDLSLDGQAALLRVLEEKVVTRIGGTHPIPVDTRVIAATNRDLAQWVQAGRFREDLYYRLNVVTLELPPLRERESDVLLLARYFLEQFARTAGRTAPRLSRSAEQRLVEHHWPGNVRELRNLMERVVYLCDAEELSADDLSFTAPTRRVDAPSTPRLEHSLTDATRLFQIDLIERHISACGGNVTEAARSLGLHRSNLYRKMQQLGMSPRSDDL
ncbi:MAG: sigma-54-dependent Fis family transcriptional regulator [Pirellulaceae bacterium]